VPEYQELKVAWDQTLTQLRATGAQLLYIRDTPYPNRRVPECISGALDDWSKCDFDLNNMNRNRTDRHRSAARGEPGHSNLRLHLAAV
jgi:hypothetical protein